MINVWLTLLSPLCQPARTSCLNTKSKQTLAANLPPFEYINVHIRITNQNLQWSFWSHATIGQLTSCANSIRVLVHARRTTIKPFTLEIMIFIIFSTYRQGKALPTIPWLKNFVYSGKDKIVTSLNSLRFHAIINTVSNWRKWTSNRWKYKSTINVLEGI